MISDSFFVWQVLFLKKDVIFAIGLSLLRETLDGVMARGREFFWAKVGLQSLSHGH
jgi:hypothetical protein